jgi:hypothetical protein
MVVVLCEEKELNILLKNIKHEFNVEFIFDFVYDVKMHLRLKLSLKKQGKCVIN